MLKNMIDKNKLSLKDIKKFLIHQANAKMDYAILKKLLSFYDYPNDDSIYLDLLPMTIQDLGNSSVATVPTLLDRILKGYIPRHKINPGDTIIMTSLGAGMHTNAIIYRFPKY